MDTAYIQLCAEMAYNEVIMDNLFENYILEQEENNENKEKKKNKILTLLRNILAWFKKLKDKIVNFFKEKIAKIKNKKGIPKSEDLENKKESNNKEEDDDGLLSDEELDEIDKEIRDLEHKEYIYIEAYKIAKELEAFYKSDLFPFIDKKINKKDAYIKSNEDKKEFMEMLSEDISEIDNFALKANNIHIVHHRFCGALDNYFEDIINDENKINKNDNISNYANGFALFDCLENECIIKLNTFEKEIKSTINKIENINWPELSDNEARGYDYYSGNVLKSLLKLINSAMVADIKICGIIASYYFEIFM